MYVCEDGGEPGQAGLLIPPPSLVVSTFRLLTYLTCISKCPLGCWHTLIQDMSVTGKRPISKGFPAQKV